MTDDDRARAIRDFAERITDAQRRYDAGMEAIVSGYDGDVAAAFDHVAPYVTPDPEPSDEPPTWQPWADELERTRDAVGAVLDDAVSRGPGGQIISIDASRLADGVLAAVWPNGRPGPDSTPAVAAEPSFVESFEQPTAPVIDNPQA